MVVDITVSCNYYTDEDIVVRVKNQNDIDNSTSLCSLTSTNTFYMADCGENSIVSGTKSSLTCSTAFIVDSVTTGDTISEVPASKFHR